MPNEQRSFRGYALIAQSLGAGQHNPSPSRQKGLTPRTVRQRIQPLLLFIGQ